MGIGTWGQGKGCLTYLWNYQMVPQLMLRVKSQYFFCFNFRKLIVVIERLTYKLFQFLVKHQLLKLKPVRENVHQWRGSRTKRLAWRCVKQSNGHTRGESCPRCLSYAIALDLRWKARLAWRCVKQSNGHTRVESCPLCLSYAVALDLRWKARRLCSEYIDLFIFVTCLWSIA